MTASQASQAAGIAELQRIAGEQAGAITSRTVTAACAVRFDGSNRAAVAASGAEVRGLWRWHWVRAQDWGWHRIRQGDWIVRYGHGDYGVMSNGAYRRYFGT